MNDPADASSLDRSPVDICRDAGLVHVDGDGPGWSRRRQGRGFSYRDERGQPINGDDRTRLEGLAIPPAWNDVWICTRIDGHLLATGRDEAGRRQHLYHPDFRAEAEKTKYRRLGPFGEHLEDLRRHIDRHIEGDDPRLRAIAGAVRIIDLGLVRVGTTRPDDPDDAVGATTLGTDDVDLGGDDRIELCFTAKGGIPREVEVKDRAPHRVIERGIELGAETVFAYEEDAVTHRVSADDVNAYLADVTGLPFTAKDFRTWGGTAIVTGELARRPPPTDDVDTALIAAVDVAAERLGNTREVARQSYVSPVVTAAYRSGKLSEIWSRTRTGKWASRAERTVRRVYQH